MLNRQLYTGASSPCSDLFRYHVPFLQGARWTWHWGRESYLQDDRQQRRRRCGLSAPGVSVGAGETSLRVIRQIGQHSVRSFFRVLERSDVPSMLDNLPGDLGCPSVSCLRSDFDVKVCLCGNFCNIPCLLTLFWIRPPIKNKTGFYDWGCMFEPIFTSVEYNCDCPYDIKLY